MNLWHRRLKHPGRHVSSFMLNNSMIKCIKSGSNHCHAYQLGRHVWLPFSLSRSTTNTPLEFIHSDVWASPVSSFSCYHYYLVILDDYSHFLWTFPLCHKSNVFPFLKNFHTYVQTQIQTPLKYVQCDNGREFDSHISHTFF